MIRDITLTAILALLFLVWFMPNKPKLTVMVSPEIENAAKRIVRERAQ